MTKLQKWMDTKGMRDQQVAAAVGVSRVQASRIRRGKSPASAAVAKRLQALTGIRWYEFIDPEPVAPKRKGVAA